MEEATAAAAGVAGVDFWRLEEPTLYLILGLVALQVAGRELFSRYGPFKSDGALFAHQASSRGPGRVGSMRQATVGFRLLLATDY